MWPGMCLTLHFETSEQLQNHYFKKGRPNHCGSNQLINTDNLVSFVRRPHNLFKERKLILEPLRVVTVTIKKFEIALPCLNCLMTCDIVRNI